MKIKFGMMMTDGRGKLGGQVASKNRAGAYVRTKVTPSNPQTTAQSVVRSVFATLAKRWSGKLTEVQREAWVEACASGEWNKTDIFGDSRKPSGFNLFVGMNSLQYAIRAPRLDSPPAKAEFLVARTLTLSAETDPQSLLEAIYDIEDGIMPNGTGIQFQATAPVSPGKKYVKNLFRDVKVVAGSPGTTTIDLMPEYEDKFGSMTGNAGKQIFVRARQVFAGQAAPWLTSSVIIE